MSINSINDSGIDNYLAALDAAMTNFDELAEVLATVAANRGFTVEVGRNRLLIECTVGGNCLKSYSYTGPQMSPEVLLDLIAFFENSEEPMNIYSTDLFKYLAGDMIGQSTVTLTIVDVTMEDMNSGRGGKQTKPVVHFHERDKVMVLNKTNAAAIAKELGPETDMWRGGRVTLAAPVIDAFGQQRRSIRVTHVAPPNTPDKPRNGATAKAPATPAPLFTDDDTAHTAALATAQGQMD